MEERRIPALTVAEGNTALGEIVRRQFHGDLVTCEHPDAVAAEAAGQMGQDYAIMFQLDAEQSAGKFLKYGSSYFNAVFFTQRLSLLLFSPIRQPAARRSRPVDGDSCDGLTPPRSHSRPAGPWVLSSLQIQRGLLHRAYDTRSFGWR